MKKNGVFLFVISHLFPEIFKIFVLCKLGTDDVIRCDNMEVKKQSRETRMVRMGKIAHGELEKFRLISLRCKNRDMALLGCSGRNATVLNHQDIF